MRFQVLNNDLLNQQRCELKPGRADFQIVAATECLSKNGNNMLKLQVRVWDCEGEEGTIFDYITSNAQWKIKQLLEAVGQGEQYETGEINSHSLENKSGKCVLLINKDPKYGNQPKIKFYISAHVESELPPFDKKEEVEESKGDIPF